MKNKPIILSFLAFAAAVCLCFTAAQAKTPLEESVFGGKQQTAAPDPDAPKAFFPQTEHTFSEALEGAETFHTFQVRNLGGSELKITKVKTT